MNKILAWVVAAPFIVACSPFLILAALLWVLVQTVNWSFGTAFGVDKRPWGTYD